MKPIGLAAAITLFGATAASGAGPPAPRTFDVAIAAGTEAYQRGEFESAVSCFSKAIQLAPSSPDPYMYRAAAYGKMGGHDKAVADFSTAIALDPKSTKALRGRGFEYASKRDFGKAAADFTAALQLDPLDAEVYYNRGRACAEMGENEKAIANYTQAVRINPKYEWAFYSRAHEYQGIARYDGAIADYSEVMRLDPNDVGAYVGRAVAFECNGEHDKAIADYSEAIRRDPKDVNAIVGRGNALENKGEHDKAIADYSAAIHLDPRSAVAHRNRGLSYFEKGDRGKAIADFDDAVRIAPKSTPCRDVRGCARVRNGDYDGGIADLRAAIALDPDDPARNFGTWSKVPLTPAALRFGEEQVRQMLHDRPAMAQYGEKADVLCRWAARKFAGEDLNQPICWNSTEPLLDAGNGGAIRPGIMPQIRLRGTHLEGERKGEKTSAEELWSKAVFELYNIAIADEGQQLDGEIAAGRLTKRDYVAKLVRLESRAIDKTRAFYVNVFLPWAKEHREPTEPTNWYFGFGMERLEYIAWLENNRRGAYPAIYERRYDFNVLRTLVTKGDTKNALALSANLLRQATANEEKSDIHIDRGCAYLIENDVDNAIAELNEAVRLEPNNALGYIHRGRAYVRKSQFEKAIADEDAAIRLTAGTDPQWASVAYCVRGWVYGMKRVYDKAIADERESMRIDPDNPEPYFRRAWIYEQMGDKDKADADRKRETELKQKKLKAANR